MPKEQSSLTSFFGGGGGGKKQSRLPFKKNGGVAAKGDDDAEEKKRKGGDEKENLENDEAEEQPDTKELRAEKAEKGGGKATGGTTSKATTASSKAPKEATGKAAVKGNDDDGDDLMDTDDEVAKPTPARPASKAAASSAVSKKRPEVDADSDAGDDDKEEDEDANASPAKKSKISKLDATAAASSGEGEGEVKAKGKVSIASKGKNVNMKGKSGTAGKSGGKKKMAIIEDDDEDDLMDTSDEEEEFRPDEVDDANDDHDDEEHEPDADDDESSDDDDDGEEEEDEAVISKLGKGKGKSKAAVKSNSDVGSKSKKMIDDVLRHPKASSSSTSKSKASSNGKKSEALATTTLSNTDLLSSSIDTTSSYWSANQPVPYRALTETFQTIEGISGRLEIQRVLTDLFRRALLKCPADSHVGDAKAGGKNGGGNGGEEAKANGVKGGKAKGGKAKNGTPASGGNAKNATNGNGNGGTGGGLKELVYLASNSVAPAYECIELGVGDSILIKAIGEASGTNPAMIKQKYEAEGDLGTVASVAKGKQRTLGFGIKPKPLLAREVLSVFRQIATTTGSQSQKWKVDKIKGLLVRAQDGSEAKYVIRGLQGKLRIGLAQSTVLVSLAHAVLLTPPEAVRAQLDEDGGFDDEKEGLPADAKKLCNLKLPLAERLECAVNIVKRAYSEVPSYDSLLEAALTVPLQHMHTACRLRPGVPVSPMLAKPTKSVQEVLKRLNGVRFTCEYKYDGERAQVHMTDEGTTKVFSRNLLDTSEKYPEVPEYVKEACASTGVKSFVLDTEVVAFNNETKQFVPFQVLSTRKKTEESAESAKVAVIVQAFDLMYLNGESLLDRTLAERRELLRKSFVPVEGKFQFATSLDHTEDGDTAVLEEFLDTAVKNQCEGLMVKTLDVNAVYKPSERSLNWLKLKKDYLEGLGDSVDLVPLGAFHGKGKRTGVFGAYLLACYDNDTEEYQSVCKIGTGFSDEDLKSLAKDLSAHIIPEKSSQYNVSDSLECDVWFDAVQVWEVKAADLSKSPVHKGAIDKTGEVGRGIGLRFPRFERVRPDKKPEQATTSDQILDMYYAQDSIVDDGAGGFDDDGI